MRYFSQLAAWAMGSFLLCMALLSPATLDAVSPTSQPAPGLAAAKIVNNGVELSISYEGTSASAGPISIKQGSSLPLELLAKNTTDQSIELQPTISIMGREVVSTRSRVMPMPQLVWQQRQPITLAAGETRTVSISPSVTLTTGKILSIQLQSGSTSIQPLTFTVKS